MRPRLLTMTAFGCYARETRVNFDALTGGLYLIVGKTGAGKTTIFDAISFALFGKPSGSERTADMLHSDYVPLSVDTEVKLDFVHQGREYHVERRMHFPKKRGAEGYGDASISASLTGAEQPALEGAVRVTERCEELLGLNAEQFRRIVMLAQGEFRQFLRANSNEKNEILGRLFDNSEYLRFQNLLLSARDSLRQQRREKEAEIATVLNTLFVLPPETGEQEGEAFLPGHPRLAENLQALVDGEQDRLDEQKRELERQREETERLTRREGAAETDNHLLRELEEKRARLTVLESQRESFAARSAAYLAAEKALHRIMPKEKDRAGAEAALQKARDDIAALDARWEQQAEELKAARETVDGDRPKAERLKALSAETTSLQKLLPRYREAAEKGRERDNAKLALEGAKQSVRRTRKEIEDLEKELTAVREELSALEGCEAELVRREGERLSAKERRDAVSDPKNGLAAQVRDILAGENALAGESPALVTLTQKAQNAENRYHALYQAFLAGQAGLIAQSMEKELAETGKTVCPVCGTPFCREEEHRFALPAEKVPDKAAVDRAEEEAREAEKKRNDRQTALDKSRVSLDQRKKAAAEQLQKLEPECSGWDKITAPDWLSALETRLQGELLEKEGACRSAQEACARKKDRQDEEKEKAREREAHGEALETGEKQCGERELQYHGLCAAVEEIQKQLPFPTEGEARTHLAALDREAGELTAELQEHEKALKAAKEALDTTSGGQKALQESLPARQEAAETARAELEKALSENGFADLDEAQAALAPIGTEDGERWLQREKQEQDDYARERENTRERIGELTVQTRGKEYTDLAELTAQLEEARERQRASDTAVKARENLLSGHRRVLETVAAAKKTLAATDRAYRRIDRLAELAVGVNSEGGKLSFDRYVMGAIFREVLVMANRRLDIMTGGRFELIHTVEAGRKNAAAGLEIQVLDVTLNKQRPAGSISGGEGFMVSLALALGLSDVVQNHAGGARLDTMFIDEGFGTLDDEKLDNVITVLKQLTEGNRLVGIISHVDKLEESIPQKLRVIGGEHGSSLVSELS